jgi:DNA-binding NtrC family response regulator/tetratricopeptide (TPR) repeat protein
MASMPHSPIPGPESLLISSRYKILRKLGSGSTGVVYLARDLVADRSVALKIIKTERLAPEVLEHLQQEFRANASLHHAQIAAAYDFGYTELGQVPFYTREYVEGVPMSSGPPTKELDASPRQYLQPILDLLDALHYLHAHEILHLDIHAGNLIVSKQKSRGAVLIDFGLVPHLKGSGSGGFLEVHSAVPPELLRGQDVGPASDLYSVGRLLLYRLTGTSDGEPRLPDEIPGWGTRLTLDLERILGKSLQDEPPLRFQSAAEFRQALLTALGGAGESASLQEPGELTVGRDAELHQIEDALRDAISGQPSCLWFVGPDGVGKTRLLTETRLRAQLRGMEVVSVPFVDDPASEPQLSRALTGIVRGRRRAPDWLEPFSVKHGGSTSDRARRVAEAYFASQSNALVLTLDDLDKADRESQLLATALLEESVRRAKGKIPGRGLVVVITSADAAALDIDTTVRRRVARSLKTLKQRDAQALLAKFVRPLEVSRRIIARLARESRGTPLRIRQLARGLHADYGDRGSVPEDVEIQPGPESLAVPASRHLKHPVQLNIVRVLTALNRPVSAKELEFVLDESSREIRVGLEDLEREEILTAHLRERTRSYFFAHPEFGQSLVRGLSKPETRNINARMVQFLDDHPGRGSGHLEIRARHLMAAGQRAEGRQVALEAVAALRREGRLHNAIRLLQDVAEGESGKVWQIRLAEEISDLFEKTGDHEEGVSLLEPLYKSRGGLSRLSRADRLRLSRRLGVHYHRSGRASEALELFGRIQRQADSRRDVEDLVFVYSEVAELHTLRGEFEGAEDACRRGLALLEGRAVVDREFHGRMEVMLRATLGHIELRRMSLEAARDEFHAASRLVSDFGTTAVHAYILNNLGVVYNQLNDFPAARRHYLKAERLLQKLGDLQGVIHTACNLATIAAKTDDASAARQHLDRAERLIERHPGQRPEFLVELTRGMVSYFLGDPAAARDAFERTIALGQRLGDVQYVGFASVYLAECCLLCGQYGAALSRLRSLASGAKQPGFPVYERIVFSRLWFLESLFGRERAACAAQARFEAIPPTAILQLEAWNDLYAALALSGDVDAASACEEHFYLAREAFDRLGVSSGRRFSRVGLLYLALRKGETGRVRRRLREVESEKGGSHRFLSVLELVARAETYLFLSENDRARDCLGKAAGSIVGLPFLDLDWRIEYLHALVADREGDREGARRSLHRALHTRALVTQSVPNRLQKAFLAHPRFEPLAELARRLEKPQLTPLLDASVRPDRGGYHDMVGQSSGMVTVFRTIDQLRDRDVPVLIQGETGTGKELVARALHRTGPRRDGPFLVLHCASLPDELFEAELFGYEEGAFTGADRSRRGMLEELAGGTLVLDDVSSLSLAAQAKILRVLDTLVMRPLGSVKTTPVDVRFLASSSASLDDLVRDGAFRGDLYYRLNITRVDLPPLRERSRDIPDLARHFLSQHADRSEQAPVTLSDEALELFRDYEWPGNVRELRALLLRLVMTHSPRQSYGVEDVRALIPVRSLRPSALFGRELFATHDLEELRTELEKSYLIHVFHEVGGDIQKMMETLDIKRSSLYRWFQRVDIDVNRLREEL